MPFDFVQKKPALMAAAAAMCPKLMACQADAAVCCSGSQMCVFIGKCCCGKTQCGYWKHIFVLYFHLHLFISIFLECFSCILFSTSNINSFLARKIESAVKLNKIEKDKNLPFINHVSHHPADNSHAVR